MAIVFRAAALLLVIATAGGCRSLSDPELALQDYARAVGEARCDDAWKFLSARTRHAIEVLRVKPQHTSTAVAVEHYYCNPLAFADCKLKKTELSEQRADAATVSMPCGRTQDSFLPGFTSIFLKYEPRRIELVREDGGWRIVEPIVIRMVEVREAEDRMRDAAMRRQERARREGISDPGAAPPPPAAAPASP